MGCEQPDERGFSAGMSFHVRLFRGGLQPVAKGGVMRPITTADILKVLPENRALILAKGLGVEETTVEGASAAMERLKVEPRRVLEAMTLEELRSVCTQRGVVPGPGCGWEELIKIVLGGRPSCEVAYLPWWSDPNAS